MINHDKSNILGISSSVYDGMTESFEDRLIEPSKTQLFFDEYRGLILYGLLWVITTHNRDTYQAIGMMGWDRGMFNGLSIVCHSIFCCYSELMSKHIWLLLYCVLLFGCCLRSWWSTRYCLLAPKWALFAAIDRCGPVCRVSYRQCWRQCWRPMLVSQNLRSGPTRRRRWIGIQHGKQGHHWDGSTHGTMFWRLNIYFPDFWCENQSVRVLTDFLFKPI